VQLSQACVPHPAPEWKMKSKGKFSVLLPVKGGEKFWEAKMTNVQDDRFLSGVDMLMMT